jgi:hypothetical protein
MDMTGLAVKPSHLAISRSDTRDQDRMLAGHGMLPHKGTRPAAGGGQPVL